MPNADHLISKTVQDYNMTAYAACQQERIAFTRFDRHANMSDEIRKSLVDLTSEAFGSSRVRNAIFGLFDGYLYSYLLPEAKEIMTEEHYKLLASHIAIIKTYTITATSYK